MKCLTELIGGYPSCIIIEIHGAIALIYWQILFSVVTDPAMVGRFSCVGTKYTISQNGTYLEVCVQIVLSVSCKMLPMTLLIDGKMFTYVALADH